MNRRRSPVSRTLTAAVVVPGCAFGLLLCSSVDPPKSFLPLAGSVSTPRLVMVLEMAGGSARQHAPAPVERKEIVTGYLPTIRPRPRRTLPISSRCNRHCRAGRANSTVRCHRSTTSRTGSICRRSQSVSPPASKTRRRTRTTSGTRSCPGGTGRPAVYGPIGLRRGREPDPPCHGPVAPPYVAILYSVATSDSCSSRIRRRTVSRCSTSMSSRSGTVSSPPSTSST